jgi:glycosyltransferase involved in cell wall biosynthesis
VIATGYVPRDVLPALYSGATAFVYPSHYEGFGLPVLEAMACGAPPIVSSAPALTELVGEAGVVLRTDTVEELTQAMERLLRFDAERESLSRRALERAAQFTPAQLGKQTAEVYRSALA